LLDTKREDEKRREWNRECLGYFDEKIVREIRVVVELRVASSGFACLCGGVNYRGEISASTTS